MNNKSEKKMENSEQRSQMTTNIQFSQKSLGREQSSSNNKIQSTTEILYDKAKTLTQRRSQILKQSQDIQHYRSLTSLSQPSFEKILEKYQYSYKKMMDGVSLQVSKELQQKQKIGSNVEHGSNVEQKINEQLQRKQKILDPFTLKSIQEENIQKGIFLQEKFGEKNEYTFIEKEQNHYELFKKKQRLDLQELTLVKPQYQNNDIITHLLENPEEREKMLQQQHEDDIKKDLKEARDYQKEKSLKYIKDKILNFDEQEFLDPYNKLLPLDFPDEKRILIRKQMPIQAQKTSKGSKRLQIQEQLRKKTKADMQLYVSGNIEIENLNKQVTMLKSKINQLEQENIGIRLQNEQLDRKLKSQHKQMTLEQFDLETANKKNILVSQKLEIIQMKYEKIIADNNNLQQFSQDYELIKLKFPSQSIESIIDYFDTLLTKSLQTISDLGKKDEELIQLEKERNKLAQLLSQKDLEIENSKNALTNNLKNQQIQQIKENQSHDQIMDYKNNYCRLFNQIISLFQSWNEYTKIYYDDQVPNRPCSANLNDPFEILEILKQYVKISTNAGCQDYLRKIIVSVNLLQRKFFPEKVNTRFNPDKIYNRISKYISKLQGQIAVLNDEVATAKKQLLQYQKQLHDSFNQNKITQESNNEKPTQKNNQQVRRGTQAMINRLVQQKIRRIGTTSQIINQDSQYKEINQ